MPKRWMMSFLICGLRFSHLENAQPPILVTLSGMLMLVRELHPSNAQSPMFVTLSGMLYNSSSALYAMIVVLSALNKTWFSYINDFDLLDKDPSQPTNGFPAILITLFGIMMLVRDLQSKYLLLVDYQCYTL